MRYCGIRTSLTLPSILTTGAKAQDNKINHLNGSVYDAAAAIDSIPQYSRRDCLEISGIPILPFDSPANLTQELGQLIGVTVDRQEISIAHRLPDTKIKKDRFIVKFVRRDFLQVTQAPRWEKSKRASIRGL